MADDDQDQGAIPQRRADEDTGVWEERRQAARVQTRPSTRISTNALRATLPISYFVTAIIFTVATVATGAIAWSSVGSRLSEHINDKTIHVDSAAVVLGGGVAFKADVNAAKVLVDKARYDARQGTRSLLKAMKINCRISHDGMNCTVDLPEDPL